ncbi:MAG: 4'-phosphopantetheinyl transferase superfamily protein [Deltaproteobacteria bacterium]|nr:4'-phosphopantetheinyl transferase superfamily protein [Deltaproteobacteria bacterium]
MPIVGVGIALVAVDDIPPLDDSNDFFQKHFSADELRDARSHPDPREFLAGRLAAKRAAAKSFGVDDTDLSSWRVRAVSGVPVLEGPPIAGGTVFHLSITHDGGLAMAVVIAETPPTG